MASGRIHARVAGMIAVGATLATPLIAAQYGTDIGLGVAGGAWAGYLVTPDIDIPHRTHEEWRIIRRLPIIGRLWTAWWAAYGQLFTHRGISHAPIIGTVTRIAYALWPLALLPTATLYPFRYMAAAAFTAWCVQDIVHLIADGWRWRWTI